MRLIISHGYGEYISLAKKLACDLASEGHQVFIDTEEFRENSDWIDQMEDAIDWAHGKNDGRNLSLIGPPDSNSSTDTPGRLILLMSEKTVGRTQSSGKSLDILAKILSRKIPVIPAMILWCETPLTIFRVQWRDMQNLTHSSDEIEDEDIRIFTKRKWGSGFLENSELCLYIK